MIGDYVKKQGQDDQKLHENRQLALFWNTPPLVIGPHGVVRGEC